jgi:hypothetical protein
LKIRELIHIAKPVKPFFILAHDRQRTIGHVATPDPLPSKKTEFRAIEHTIVKEPSSTERQDPKVLNM